MKRILLSLMVLAGSGAAAQDDANEELRRQWQEIEAIALERAETPAGDERDVLSARIAVRARTLRSEFRTLQAGIQAAEEEGTDASSDRALAAELLAAAAPLIRREIEYRRDLIQSRYLEREETPAEERLELERRLTRENQELDVSMSTLLEIIEGTAALDLEVADDEAFFDRVLQERSEELTARTELMLTRRNEATARLRGASSEETASIEAELQTTREALHGNVASLESLVSMMDRRGMDSTTSKQLLIQATGTVTTDIFDTRVLSGVFTRTWESVREWVVTRGPQLFLNLLFFCLIVGGFRILAGAARKLTERAVTRTRADLPVLLKNMLVSMSGKLILILGIIVALPQIGIDIGPLLAGVGVAGFIVGFALQDTLSNFASGVMILVYRPFDVGDVVEAGGVSGKVSFMSVVSTTIRTFDNQVLIVPNNKIWGDVIRNKTAVLTRRVDLTFGIGYEDDIAHAERVLHEIVDSHELVLDEPPPTIKLHELGDSSVNFVVRPWVNTKDYWEVHWDVTRAVKQRFDEEGISIPFPQRDVHVHDASPRAAPHANLEDGALRRSREAVSPAGVAADED